MALQRMYNNLDIRCKSFAKCNKTVKLIDLEKHELDCCSEKCANYEICGKNAAIGLLQGISACSHECQAFTEIFKTNNKRE